MLPPSLMPLQMPKGTILDWSGTPIQLTVKPPTESIAKTGRVRDPWLLQTVTDITPELFGRMIRPDYPLPIQMAMCKRMLATDGHLASCYRDMVSAVSGLDWEILPFNKTPEAKRVHDLCEQWVDEFKDKLDTLFEHLLAGEFFPFAGAEIEWGDDYLPHDFYLVDPVRWYRESQTNTLKIRTLAEPWFGEYLPPQQFILHRSRLSPGSPFEGGLWRPSGWLYIFKHYAVADEMQYAEIFGKPFRIAFYQKREDKDSILQAMQDMGANAVGVFPAGTEVRLEENNHTGTVDVYRHIIKDFCDDEISELFVGHPLITGAKSGSGTLAGHGAQKVHEKIVRSIARRLGATLRDYLLRPMVGYQLGVDAVKLLPIWKFKYEPPEDDKTKAEKFVAVNTILAAVGEAIDPQQVRDEFNIPKTVPRAAAIDPGKVGGEQSADKPIEKTPGAEGEPDPNDAGEANEDPQGEPQKDKAAAAKRRRARASSAPASTPIETADDVETVAAGIGTKALKNFGASIKSTAEKAKSIEEFMAACWEAYSSLDTRPLAAVMRDGIITADVIGREEVIE